MSDLLGNAMTWLEGQRHEHLTKSVTYSRGGEAVSLNATVGRTEREGTDEYGRTVVAVARDYLIRAEDLAIGGETVLPSAGDTITDGDATFEVMSLGEEGPWRYSDPNRTALRIHTKEV